MSGTVPPTTPVVAPVVPAAASLPVAENSNLWRGVVSVAVMAAFGAVVALVLTHAVPETATTQNVISTLSVLATTVVTYWMGSSAGSTSKTLAMTQMTPVVPPTTSTTDTTTTSRIITP